MTSLARHMAVYAAYHRDPRNRLTHFIGVPAIAFAILIPMAWARTDIAGVTLSLAMLFTAAVLVVYLWYDRTLALAAMCAFAPLLFTAERVAALTPFTGWTVFAVFFVGGWVFQLVGHAFEGRRPALVDNILQICIAPLFLIAEIFVALGWRRRLHDRVEAVISERYPDYAAAEGPRAEPAAE